MLVGLSALSEKMAACLLYVRHSPTGHSMRRTTIMVKKTKPVAKKSIKAKKLSGKKELAKAQTLISVANLRGGGPGTN
jgi:hypothetical protein